MHQLDTNALLGSLDCTYLVFIFISGGLNCYLGFKQIIFSSSRSLKFAFMAHA